jgi:serine/threonine protein kinase
MHTTLFTGTSNPKTVSFRSFKANSSVLYSYRTGWWTVTDFGLATGGSTASLQYTANRRVTESYAAPEVLDDFQFNKKSDIWALGCILYEVCTGRRAFNSGWHITTFSDSNPFTLYPFVTAVVDGHPPGRINELVELMLKRDGTQRPQITAVCRSVEMALHSVGSRERYDFRHAGPSERPATYFDDTTLVGTETPLWKAKSPFIEQLMPTRTYRHHLSFVRRRERILDARRKFLGRFNLVTAWTKVYLAWTIYRSSRPEPAWAYLNAARTDLLEIHQDKNGAHPSQLVVQAGLLRFALGSSPFSQTLSDESELLMRKMIHRCSAEDQLAVRLRVLKCQPDRPNTSELESLISTSTQQLGPTHHITLSGRVLRGWWLYCDGQTEAGRREMMNARMEMERLWGPYHSECLSAKRVYAHTWTGVANVEILISNLRVYVELFGPTQALTRQIAKELRIARRTPENLDMLLRAETINGLDQVLASYEAELESLERQGISM